MTAFDQDLYKALKNGNYLDIEKLDFCLKTAKEQNASLSEVLLRNGAIADSDLGKVIADMVKIPFVSIAKTKIPSPTLHILAQNVAEKQLTIPFEETAKSIKVATASPDNADFFTFLAQKTGKAINVNYATPHDIADAIHLYNHDLSERVAALVPKEDSKDKKSTSLATMPVAQIVDTIITYGYKNRAAAIHIEPEDEKTLVRFRIDGLLHDQLQLPKQLHSQIVTRLKELAKIAPTEQSSAQEGMFKVQLAKELADIRVSMVPLVAGESVVLHLSNAQARQVTLYDLGLSEQDLQNIESAIAKPFGTIIVTGPGDSGKTTTVYSMLKKLNTRDRNIASVEEVSEYQLDGVNQLKIDSKNNITIAQGLRSILKQDPNVIFISDIDEPETAGIATNSALTGHLVLAILHATDSVGAIQRLSEMNIEPFLIASTVTTIISQRLVRTICQKCRETSLVKLSDLPKEIPKNLITEYFGEKKEIRLAKGKGCAVCHKTGYVGRTGIFEVLVVSEAIRQLIIKKADPGVIEKKAASEGLTTMLEDGIAKVHRNETTIEEVIRAIGA